VSGIDLDAALEALFSAPIATFVAQRDALAKDLRGEKRKEEAARVRALQRPSVPAWVANALHRRAPDAMSALYRAGDQLRVAHRKLLELGDGDALRDAVDARRAAILVLRPRAAMLVAEAGSAPSGGLMARVEATLEALCVADPGVRGRLANELGPIGFVDAQGSVNEPSPPTQPSPLPPPIHRESASGSSIADEESANEELLLVMMPANAVAPPSSQRPTPIMSPPLVRAVAPPPAARPPPPPPAPRVDPRTIGRLRAELDRARGELVAARTQAAQAARDATSARATADATARAAATASRLAEDAERRARAAAERVEQASAEVDRVDATLVEATR
jgi:hypothetical protein